MRVQCRSCGYIAPTFQDYIRHLEAYPECEGPKGINENMKRSRPSKKERKKLAMLANQQSVGGGYTSYAKVEDLASSLSPAPLFDEGAQYDEKTVPRAIVFQVTPSRK